MKIAIKTSATQNDNQFRGIGFYTQNLFENLKKLENKDFELITFTNQIPQADLYHFPDFNPFFFSFPFNLINKSIITIHDLIPIEYSQYYPAGIKGNLRWQIQKKLLKFSPQIITDSISSQNSIAKILNIPKAKITPIYLGPGNSSSKISKKINFDLPKEFILYVGDLNWNKNIMFLAETCVELKIPLIVVGKQAANTSINPDHPWNKELVAFQNYVKQNKDLIKCLGFVSSPDLNFIYQKALCLVSPSIAEGFGLPVLEAMKNSCPVISSNRTSLPEVGGDACLYFDPYKKQELISQIKKLKNDLNLRKQFIEKGLYQANKFSWEKTAKQTQKNYQKVYERKI